MAGNFEYYAELGLNAGSAINELSRVSSTADTVTKNLDAMGKALDQVSKKGLRQGDEKQLGDTLKLYQQLAGAVQAYGKSLQTINSTDLNNGVRKTATSLDHMHKALTKMGTVDSAKVKGLKDTLGLYKQLADASAKYASTMKLEADAIKAVAAAEKTRAATAASAANATTRGGTDMWGVSKEERDQRRMAQVVMQAEREMNAEFARREETQRKARAEAEKTAQAEAARATQAEKSAAATTKAAASEEQQQQALASTRYALYEVAAAYTATAAAALALPVASAQAAIEMEAQFAHVKRTTQAAGAPLAALRNEFVDLSTEIPVTFEELSRIGTLGAQMGIAVRDLDEFTEVVAKFAATTNVTADEAATYFGRIANMMSDLDPSKYENFGAAVSELGTASVSTEKEILAVAESIATTANMAGFSSAEVIGLSTAMASLRIRPEMARGAMQRVFAKINVAVGDGTEQLGHYARMLGMTEEAAADLWRNDPSTFFFGINDALSKMEDNIAKSQFIREGLGFTNIRDVEMLARLSNGIEVYADSLNLAQDAYARGDYLEKESGVIFETTAASLERLANAFKAMLDSFGQTSLAPIKGVAEALIGVLNWVRDSSPAFKSASTMLLLLVGGFAAFKAAIALTTASMLAFQMIQRQLAPEGRVTFATLKAQAADTFPGMKAQIDAASLALANFRTQLAGTPGVMGKAAVATAGFGRALGALGWAGGIGLALTAASAVWGIAQAHESAAEKAREHANAFIERGGGMESLMEAMRKDAEEFASGAQTEVFGRLNVQMEATEPAARTAAQALTGTLIPAHEEQAAAVRDTTDAYVEGIGAIGKYTDEWMRQGLADAIGDVLSGDDVQALIETGFDFNRLTTLWQTQGRDAAVAYTREFAARYTEHFNSHNYAADQAAAVEGALLRTASLAAEKVGEQFVDMNSGLESINSKMMTANALGVNAFDDLGEGAEGASDAISALDEELSGLLDTMFRVIDAEAGVFEAMESLGAGLAENGFDFNTWTEEGRANLENFRGVLDAMLEDIIAQVETGALNADEAASLFGQQYEQLLGQLASLGVDTSQFDYFREYIDTLFSTPAVVEVDTTHAEQIMARAQERAESLGAALSALTGKGYAVAEKPSSTATSVAQRRRVNRPVVRPGATAPSPAMSAYAQALAASHAAAEQKRLADEAERAAKETERQAKEQKRAADEAKKLRDKIAEAKDEGRIFEEIIKGLGQAFKNTLHQFNNFQASRDSVEQRLINMRQAAQDAADKVRDLREEHAKLRREASEDRTDARQAESFAAVARQYGDTERAIDYSEQAEKARASAKEKERLASEALKESRALDANRNSLTGYSEQAIKNRGDVRALQQEMTDLIVAYAETGATTEEVTAFAEGLRRKFVDQLTQMGYNRDDVIKLSGVFIDLKEDIERVPREVRIKAEAEVAEAEAALREVARGRTATIEVVPKNDNFTLNGNLLANDFIVGRQIKSPSLEVGRVTDYGNGITSNWARRGGGLIPGPSNPRGRDNMLVVGPNGPEGTVGSGEFVIRKPAVDAIGLNALHAINSMSPGAAAMSSAPAVNASRTGIQLVEILPHQISQIAQAVSTVLAVDGKVLAGTTNAQNTNAARRGVK